MKSPQSGCGGFTLLEVMVALAIVGIVMVAMLGLIQRNILLNEHVQQMTRATLLAKQRMAEIEGGMSADVTQLQGVFAEPDDEFRWQLTYTPTPIIGVQQVDLDVLWGDEAKNEMVTLTSFVKVAGP
jgi:general secretion pathway protein I